MLDCGLTVGAGLQQTYTIILREASMERENIIKAKYDRKK